MIVEVGKDIFIGDKQAATEKSPSFSCVINVTTDVPFVDENSGYRIPVLDIGVESQQEIMFENFPRACKLIEDVLAQGGRILVHCSEGKQRSCTVVCAYYVWKYNLDAHKAVAALKERHRLAFADSSVHFLQSLIRWHTVLEVGVAF
jgi:protein-tyrosine phosphatase